MSSTTRVFVQRSSALRTQILRRQARPAYRFSARRGYSSAHGAAQKSSDMPWLIAAVGVTVPTVAYLWSTGPSRSSSSSSDHHASAEQEEKAKEESNLEFKDASKNESDGPKGGKDPSAPGKASQSGQNVPPPSGDNSDLATNWDEKKERKQEFDAQVKEGNTRVATSSSSAPSKKTASEDPREDPQKGEGEAVQKGSSKN